jgi:hypothetical protein
MGAHISLVFGEMWDTTALDPKLFTPDEQLEVNIRQSHIPPKTSEIWGTQVHGSGDSATRSIRGSPKS